MIDHGMCQQIDHDVSHVVSGIAWWHLSFILVQGAVRAVRKEKENERSEK